MEHIEQMEIPGMRFVLDTFLHSPRVYGLMRFAAPAILILGTAKKVGVTRILLTAMVTAAWRRRLIESPHPPGHWLDATAHCALAAWRAHQDWKTAMVTNNNPVKQP